MLLLILIILLPSLLLLYVYLNTGKPKNFPPGPPRWSPFYSWYPSESFFRDVPKAMAKYGKVFGFYLGRTPVVMVADFQTVKEIFKREEISGRPPNRPVNEFRYGYDQPELEGCPPGIVFAGGRHWRDQRRFVVRHLKDFGFGKSSMEGLISTEVSKLVDLYRGKVGEPFILKRSVNISIINALWTILAGDSFELDDPKLKSVVLTMEKTMGTQNTTYLPLSFILPHPSILKLPLVRNLWNMDKVRNMWKEMYGVIDPSYEEHLETFQRDSPRDLMDLIIQENQDCTDPASPFFGPRGHDAIFNIFVELFLAGIDTTSSSLIWTFLYLLHHPEAQGKVHQELDRVCGRDRLPCLSDQENLPYTNAVLHESFRITGLVYNNLPHFTTKETEVMGYTVPKGAIVYACLRDIMNDPEVWKEPDRFTPERFLDAKTGKFVPNERVMPFSVGKRACPGQSLAEKQFFLFFTGILQSFEILADEDSKLPGYGPESTQPYGPQRFPPQYLVVLKSRTG